MQKKTWHNLVIVLATACLFFIVAMPFHQLFQVVDATEVRPAGAFNPLFGLLFGFAGALGCAIGNVLGDYLCGYGFSTCFFGFFIQLAYGILPYLLWKIYKSDLRLNTMKNLIKYISIMLISSGFVALAVGVMLQILGTGELLSTTTVMIFLNDFVFSIILGIPILLIYTWFILKKQNKSFSLNERFIAIFILLSVISASMIGLIVYNELQNYIVDKLSLWNRVYMYIIANLLLLLVVIIFSLRYAERKITIPMEELSRVAVKYIDTESSDKLDTKWFVEQCNKYAGISGESGELATAFRDMSINLAEYIENITKVTAENERIGAELNVATQIQAGMLPCIFPAFPQYNEFDIYATMTPAKEVGGDFYDYFMTDSDHLALVMADVSGKGVPAALFMMISKILLKNSAQLGFSPKEVLEKVNNQLCANNDAQMFVTVWLGILEISTGKMVCANAGHEYPAIKRKNGEFELYKDKHGFVLAGMENLRYKEYELELFEGDSLFVYTDGVAEATDSNNELFNTERMLNALNNYKGEDCKGLLENVKREINAFVGDAPQFDDITMLNLKINAILNFETIAIDLANNSSDEIIRITQILESVMEKNDASMKTITQINIAIDELVSNIFKYSNAHSASVKYKFNDGKIILMFVDDGVEYNPLNANDPDITLSAEERQIGGLGIFIVKKSMDSVSYEYKNANIFTIRKTLK